MALGTACARFQRVTLSGLRSATPVVERTVALRLKTSRLPGVQRARSGLTPVWALMSVDTRSALVSAWELASDDIGRGGDDWTRRGGSGSGTVEPAASHEYATLGIPYEWASLLPAGAALKVRSHAAAVALQIMFHNFCLVHPETGLCPSMAAGIEGRAWRPTDIVALHNDERWSPR